MKLLTYEYLQWDKSMLTPTRCQFLQNRNYYFSIRKPIWQIWMMKYLTKAEEKKSIAFHSIIVEQLQVNRLMHQTPFLSMNYIVSCINPKRAGGGAKRPPLMFRTICPQRDKLSPQRFTTFFCRISRIFWNQIIALPGSKAKHYSTARKKHQN